MAHIIVQHVLTRWTKESRGGDGARTRNSVAEAMRLPEIARDVRCLLHRVEFSEWKNFERVEHVRTPPEFPTLNLRDVEVDLDDDELTVRFIRDGFNAASPRPAQATDVFTLGKTQWGRIIYNGRYSDIDTGQWSYQKSVYNIAWLTTADRDVFRSTEPAEDFSELAILR